MKDKINELFNKWYGAIIFDSTGTRGFKEHDELILYCKDHLDIFKEFAEETLENPCEACYKIADLCDELLVEPKQYQANIKFIPIADTSFLNELKEKLEKSITTIKTVDSETLEDSLWDRCNYWLNKFKETEGIDYYKSWKQYKRYLHNHYIGWKPNEENDPNPTYEEFKNNKEKYE